MTNEERRRTVGIIATNLSKAYANLRKVVPVKEINFRELLRDKVLEEGVPEEDTKWFESEVSKEISRRRRERNPCLRRHYVGHRVDRGLPTGDRG